MHQHVLRVRVFCCFLGSLLKEIILVFERSCAHHRYASLFLHAWNHLVFGLNLLNLFTKFCYNHLSFSSPCLLDQIFFFSLLLIIFFLIDILILLIGLFIVILLLLCLFLPLLPVFFLLVFKLLLV